MLSPKIGQNVNNKNGEISHFYNEKTGEKSYDVPIDSYYLQKVKDERAKHQKEMINVVNPRAFGRYEHSPHQYPK